MATRMKEKTERRLAEKDVRPVAHARHIRMSATKARATLDLIRGQKYTAAVAILEHTPTAASEVVIKAVNSAAANAEMKNYAKNELFVAEAYADEGPTLKRMMARGKGSSNRIDKRTCHITVIMDSI
ncbi:MAG: 50S ribosomal protein L22 [Clostridiales bacterium]|nr:50S ribosomal protein L22 [Clostridiales bacterium]